VTGCLAELSALVRARTGLVLPPRREAALLAALRRAAPRANPCDAVHAIAGRPADQPAELFDRLIDELTIQESSFMRHRSQLELIDWQTLRASARDRGAGRIRVWSCGCAQGEEAYTLALLAAEAFAPEPAPVLVLGTDISRRALEAARTGRYGPRAVRALEPRLRARYLEHQADGSYVVGDVLRGMVRFARHNLAGDPFPPRGETAFDVIACRNVLIYFGATLASRVIGALERSLRSGGLLMLGAADALLRDARPAGPSLTRQVRRGERMLRRPLGLAGGPTRQERLSAALDAADLGRRDRAEAELSALLVRDPMDAEAQFVHGLVALEAGDSLGAAAALRRALYADSTFALAAFTLGRAYDALGDGGAARRSYRQALHYLDPDDQRTDLMLKHVDIADIAAACRARLAEE
jgi:chemotaxis methyl-accepting protein methylase